MEGGGGGLRHMRARVSACASIRLPLPCAPLTVSGVSATSITAHSGRTRHSSGRQAGRWRSAAGSRPPVRPRGITSATGPLLPGPATPASTLAARLWSFGHTWMCFPPPLPRPPQRCSCPSSHLHLPQQAGMPAHLLISLPRSSLRHDSVIDSQSRSD